MISTRLRLRDESLQLEPLGLSIDPSLRLLAGAIEIVALTLGHPQAIELLLPHLGELLHSAFGFLDGLEKAVGADDVLQVLKQSIFVGPLCLGLHQRDLLNLTLQDQEAIVLEVDASLAQQLGDLCEVTHLVVDVVLRRVVAEGLTAHHQDRPLHNFVILWPITRVDDVLKSHRDFRARAIRKSLGTMNEFRNLLQAHLFRPFAEDEEQCVDGVRFPTAVWSDDRRKALVEGANDLLIAIGLEVL
mmetsp:Transcript_96610/g.207268  ORF Transcript_96610/g.207268 Transcript_96610/m.207268 type:complete len:245 (+) Transcript_96610:3239-3973(+)